MTEILTAEQIDDLDQMITEQESGVTPYSDAIDAFVSDNSRALIAMAFRMHRAELAAKWSSDVAIMAINDMQKSEAEATDLRARLDEAWAIAHKYQQIAITEANEILVAAGLGGLDLDEISPKKVEKR